RFTRKKHDSGFPQHAVQYCLDEAGIKLADVDYVAFYDKPFVKCERLLETSLAYAPRGFQSFRMAMPLWLKEKLFQKTLLRDEMKHWQPDFDWHKRLLLREHHHSQRASALFPPPTRSACSIRRSPTTRASRSIPASTRSWVWHPMASRSSRT